MGFNHRGPWPDGAYTTVRALPQSWAAVLAVRGHVLQSTECETRSEAFDLAIRKAEYEGIPSLVKRAEP